VPRQFWHAIRARHVCVVFGFCVETRRRFFSGWDRAKAGSTTLDSTRSTRGTQPWKQPEDAGEQPWKQPWTRGRPRPRTTLWKQPEDADEGGGEDSAEAVHMQTGAQPRIDHEDEGAREHGPPET